MCQSHLGIGWAPIPPEDSLCSEGRRRAAPGPLPRTQETSRDQEIVCQERQDTSCTELRKYAGYV